LRQGEDGKNAEDAQNESSRIESRVMISLSAALIALRVS
jgi:hypothetical protein